MPLDKSRIFIEPRDKFKLKSFTGIDKEVSTSALLEFLSGVNAVLSTPLTGYVDGNNTPISSSNTVLTAFQDLQAQVTYLDGVSNERGIWRYNTDTTATDPNSGRFKLNNATVSLATELYIYILTNDGIDASNLFSALREGDVLYAQNKDDASNWARFSVSATPTNNSGWFTIPITYITGDGTAPSNNDKILFSFNYQTQSSGVQSADTLLVASVTLTSAQVTGKTLVSITSVPSGKDAVLISYWVVATGSGSYTGTLTWQFQQGSASSETLNETSSFFQTAADLNIANSISYFPVMSDTLSMYNIGTYSGEDIYVKTAGTIAGSGSDVKVYIAYRLFDL